MRKRTADFLQGTYKHVKAPWYLIFITNLDHSSQPSQTGERRAGAQDCQWSDIPCAELDCYGFMLISLGGKRFTNQQSEVFFHILPILFPIL